MANRASPPTSRRRLALGVAWLLAAALPPGAAGAQPATSAQPTGDLVDRSALRVCSDPDDLPFSNEAGEGFENEIAELMAARLGVPLEYAWHPQSVGFVRNTLRAHRCDLIMGVVAADELVQNTNPYYRSTYVMLVREEDKERLAGLGSPEMATARFGVIAGTPPADLLARRGLIGRVQPYNLVVDTRVEKPARQLLDDLVAGATDVGMLWGPIAGYWTKREGLPLAMTPLEADPRSSLRTDFRISMGVRQEDQEWKREVNRLIRELQPRIDRVLLDYGVPLLDERGRLVTAAAAAAAPVPEPAGYRTGDYRAPVPATLAGATVLDTAGLRRLLEERRPVLVDVLPKPRPPADRGPDKLWVEPRRDDIPGSHWLPNVGYGELAPEYRSYLERGLAELTGGDKARPVVFYCDPDCWMSWNAAKRAVTELGYTDVYWYPEGAKGWQQAGLALAPAREIPQPAFGQQ